MQKKKKIEENSGKDLQKSQENWISQGNISWKDGLHKGQKWSGPNRSRRY